MLEENLLRAPVIDCDDHDRALSAAPQSRHHSQAFLKNHYKYQINNQIDGMMINQPTWGVDAGASATIRQAIVDLSRAGSAVMVISQDLDEIFEIADRIAVISRGELSEAHRAAEISLQQIGLLMAGAHEKKGETAHAARA